MKTLTFALLFFSMSSYSQKYSLGVNVGHVRFMDTWVSGISTDVYFKANLPLRLYVKGGLGRASGFDTYYNEENDIPENNTYFANVNNRVFAGLGIRLIDAKNHQVSIEPQATFNAFKEHSDYQTIVLPNTQNGNQMETFRKKAFYEEGTTLGYGYSADYQYKFKNVGLGCSVGFNRYGDYRLRTQTLNFVYFFKTVSSTK